MEKVVLDAATLAKLRNGPGPVEVCDESGRVVGHFTPATDPTLYRTVVVPFSEEELDQAEQEEEETFSTEEVLAHLKSPEKK